MKKVITLFVCATLFCLTGCKVGNSAASFGLPDQAFIYMESIGSYKNGVQVTIDKETTFAAKVFKPKKHMVKGDVYAVATGKRHVSVFHNGKEVYSRTIMLAPQETHKIILP